MYPLLRQNSTAITFERDSVMQIIYQQAFANKATS